MYNFLDPKLMPKVTCNSPETENYEACNLINSNLAIRARGYMAYTVIRPPVELEFEFLCPINIAFMTLRTTVGLQKCTGIEIFAKASTTQYTSIAKAFYDTSGLTFCNRRKYSKTNPPQGHDENHDIFFFKSDTFSAFSDASCLKVVIFRTQRQSVPCLGAIKVFGVPSKTCSRTTIETINKLMGNFRNCLENHNTKPDLDLVIPTDFIDSLTCEVMAVPMTLPSGKTVDRDTLQKHIENEKSFGRPPCDPFTGLKFTDVRKPVLNVALKSRIDMFLMRNSNDPITFGLKRTVGSGGDDNFKRLKLNSEPKCCVCEINEHLYVIPCRHCYCRNCLLSVTIWKCNDCKKEFSKNAAMKFHN